LNLRLVEGDVGGDGNHEGRVDAGAALRA
jgi:hypothetical protein